ncbi:MAG TPA: YncE family protein [Stellaceae bacterium]|nr:YncE family protein [Stellaceae bacterium]
MRRGRLGFCRAAAVLVIGLMAGSANAQLMIVGNDEKITWDEAGKAIQHEPGKDTVSILDISKPDAPKVVTTFPLANTIVGPPTNLAIHPSGEIALIANSVNPEREGSGWKNVPDDKVFVIDLKAGPPKVIATINAGKQPSGMAISAKGDIALVANRADGTISVLSIKGKDVKVVDTVSVGAAADSVSAVAITPDGKRAFVAKAAANKVAVLSIDGEKVTYDKRDLPTGIFPYNVAVAPSGKIAIAVNNGAGGGSDGNVDTASVIDLEADPPRVIDHVVVGDAPEGFAISPKGNLAVAILLRGSNADKKAFYYNPGGAVVALKIDGKKVTKTGEVVVGGLPEGVVFSPQGDYLYVGNFIDQDLSVLKVDGDKITDTGTRFKLPGHPASMRAGPQ